MASGGTKVVYAALAGNLLVAVTKTAAAVFTGSSAMLSEAVHSFVDTGNEVLLLYGLHRAGQRPDREHPFGYGRELYFWSFVVALLVFAVGAGVSLYEGVQHLSAPEPITNPIVNYVVLALSLAFETGSWIVAFRQMRASKGDQSYWQAIVRSKDPPQFMVLLEDTAAILGILIAFAGTWAAVAWNEPRLDGVASIVIGLLLAAVAALLARESKGLLIGERADPALHAAMVELAAGMQGIDNVNGLITAQLAPQQVLAALSLEFEDKLRVGDVERIVAELEVRVRRHHPEVTALFVKPQPQVAFAAQRPGWALTPPR
jgi:cation diffusion facilitator family transporter